jgi:hypothetical protein
MLFCTSYEQSWHYVSKVVPASSFVHLALLFAAQKAAASSDLSAAININCPAPFDLIYLGRIFLTREKDRGPVVYLSHNTNHSSGGDRDFPCLFHKLITRAGNIIYCITRIASCVLLAPIAASRVS